MGTQGTKALLWEKETGEVLGRGSVGYSLTSTRPGQAEQRPAAAVEQEGQQGGEPMQVEAAPAKQEQEQQAAAAAGPASPSKSKQLHVMGQDVSGNCLLRMVTAEW